MTLFGLLLFLIVAGIAVAALPIEGTIKRVIIGLVIIVAVVWFFASLGWISSPVFFRR